VNAAESGPSLLHVWLITDGGDGVIFMANIGLMLRRITEREGAGIAPVDRPSDAHGGDSVHFFAQLSPEAVPILRGEVGVHRAQLVPAGSESGRICTSLVAVEMLAPRSTPSSGRPSGPVLRTYNYVQQRVTYHPTGEVHPLATVFRGEVR
jgi:protein subunit release factor A